MPRAALVFAADAVCDERIRLRGSPSHLLLPHVEQARLDVIVVAQILYRDHIDQMRPQNNGLLVRGERPAADAFASSRFLHLSSVSREESHFN